MLNKLFPYRYLLIVVLTTIGYLPLFIAEGGFLPVCDATWQVLPFVVETKRMLESGTPMWSWNSFLGDNFIGSYTYYTLTSPFALFNCLFPYKYIVLGFTITLYLKILACAFVSDMYFREIGFGKDLRLIGCLLYAFCTWALTNSYYHMFWEPMIAFPILLIFIERFIKRKRYMYSGLAAASAITAIANFYFIPANFIAGALYFFVRIYSVDSTSYNKALLILRAVGCVMLGLGVAAVAFMPVYFQLAESPRGNFDINGIIDAYLPQSRILSLFLPYYNIHSIWPFYPFVLLPNANVYVFGIFPLLLFFYSKSHWRAKLKLAYIAACAMLYVFPLEWVIQSIGYRWAKYILLLEMFSLIPLVFFAFQRGLEWYWRLSALLIVVFVSPLNGVFNLFTTTLYCRWLYALIMVLIVGCLSWIKRTDRVANKWVWGYVAFCICVLTFFSAFSELSPNTTFNFLRIGFIWVLSLLNLGVLIWICGSDAKKRTYRLFWGVSLCCVAQMLVTSYTLIGGEGDHHILQFEKQCSAYRQDTDMTHRTSILNADKLESNLGIVINRPSIIGYNSVFSQTYYGLIESFQPEYQINAFSPPSFHDSFAALTSVKYLWDAAKGTDPSVAVSSFPHYIPMGFAYDFYAVKEDVNLKEGKDNDLALGMLNALVIKAADEPILSKYMEKTDFSTNAPLDSVVAARRQVVCDDFTGDTRGFSATISLDKPRVIFFSVITDPGFTAYIDGNPTEIYEANTGFSAVVVPAGRHHIRFEYFTPGLKTGALISFLSLSLLVAVFVFERRRMSSLNMDTSK